MAKGTHNILMLAAENDIIPGAKVGGIGDVIRDIPRALAALGHCIDVVIPSYGLFHELPGSVARGQIETRHQRKLELVDIYELYRNQTPNVRYWVLEHPLFSACGTGKVYCNDAAGAPFASDANKFSLFSIAACDALKQDTFGPVDTIHCHDWHTAFVPILLEYDPRFVTLKSLRCVYSIHNLAIQGIRPFKGATSSLETWFPNLEFKTSAIADPRWPTCVNPVVGAINLSDRVHTVSPSYAVEIQQEDDILEKGFHGGEGLEDIISTAATQDKLVGILNGCEYGLANLIRSDWQSIRDQLEEAVNNWIAGDSFIRSADYIADKTLKKMDKIWGDSDEPQHIVTSIGRLTAQKVRLLTYMNEHGESALDRLLEALQGRGVLIILGTGDPEYEHFLARTVARHNNFLFLNRYAQSTADLLYTNGTLFLMPSSFEPCGISQMLAMKHGQPCLVHAVGGLKDTVKDDIDGFHFSSDSFTGQGEELVKRFESVLALKEKHPVRWQAICKQARETRFHWKTSARDYVDQLYTQ